MDKKDWLIITIMVALIVLVVIFWDKFIIKKEEIIEADYCVLGSDCVLVVNPYTCCIQPVPMNKKAVELDEGFVVYDEDFDGSIYETSEDCSFKECPAFPPISANVNLKCYNNKCTYNN